MECCVKPEFIFQNETQQIILHPEQERQPTESVERIIAKLSQDPTIISALDLLKPSPDTSRASFYSSSEEPDTDGSTSMSGIEQLSQNALSLESQPNTAGGASCEPYKNAAALTAIPDTTGTSHQTQEKPTALARWRGKRHLVNSKPRTGEKYSLSFG